MKKKIKIAGTAVVVAFLMTLYMVFGSNLKMKEEARWFYVYTGDDFETVVDRLDEFGLRSTMSFRIVASLKKYNQRVTPGRFQLRKGMGNNAIINTLRIKNRPVKWAVNGIRTLDQLTSELADKFEVSKVKLDSLLAEKDFMEKYHLTPEQSICLFIPNTYEIFWNTSEEALIDRMYQEYLKFWDDDRMARAKRIGLKPVEIMTLASIVEEEQSRHRQEWATIAGLYINRLKKGIRLESDPTVKFSVGDFNIRRVLKKHLRTKSPYNTYINKGLPPGPIRLADPRAIEAVLDHKKHEYLFMCAKIDGSSLHHFTCTYDEHKKYAAEYRKSLNKKKIYK